MPESEIHDISGLVLLLNIQNFAAAGRIQVEKKDFDDGEAVMFTENGDYVSYHVIGMGYSTKKGYEGKVQLTLQFMTNSDSEELQRLCKKPVLAEYEIDEEGHTTTTYYEWNF